MVDFEGFLSGIIKILRTLKDILFSLFSSNFHSVNKGTVSLILYLLIRIA